MSVINRRTFLKSTIALGWFGTLPLASSGVYAEPIHPKPDNLREGDLLWARKPYVCIPYKKEASDEEARRRWQRQVEDLLAKAKSRGDEKLVEAAKRLSTMTEDQFSALYLDDQKLDEGVNYSGGHFAVGHVAIVGRAQGSLYVVEATPGTASPIEMLEKCFDNGVKQTPYSDWIADHDQQLVWHGRPFPSLPDSDRAKIPTKALNYLGRQYCFDNLDLGDSSGFYCSKLVWLCVREALNKFIDDDPEPRRHFWLSPKQILNSKNVQVLFSPSRYGCL